MGIGERLKQVREEKKISVAAVASAAGVSRQAVYAWESGDTKSFKGSNLVAVAKLLDLSVEWLDTGKGERSTFRENAGVSERRPMFARTSRITESVDARSPTLTSPLDMM